MLTGYQTSRSTLLIGHGTQFITGDSEPPPLANHWNRCREPESLEHGDVTFNDFMEAGPGLEQC